VLTFSRLLGFWHRRIRHEKVRMKVYKEPLLAMLLDCWRCPCDGLCRVEQDASGSQWRPLTHAIHMADMGTDNYEQEFTLSLMQNRKVCWSWSSPLWSG